ncbi:putative Ntn-hydrolase superfamily protein [Bacillus mesophilus]|uniref:DUF1028 domain-containing protein n=1 Tax=Bacillus mesophilus TaxID=1808955 RepID=A0A6M0Q7S3_9BACI|nr:DUF1028 domain-containing protein [Bacillus mesophilus]MBM7661675.1 putative Ntn-hydrolase superfamily protein [Bacillus mesophilus]NEY72337.1 DUF1028 domain-containing protein [Bacillus mesophilus]
MKSIKIPRDYVNTFSIVGYDPETKEHGVAVASKFLAVGSLVPWAKAGVGAIATQSWVNVDYGRKGLQLMEEGKSAEEALSILTEHDDKKNSRQVGLVDANGNGATHTGEDCYSWAGGLVGENFACQGNILVDDQVVVAMSEAFKNSTGDLATRLLKALSAGDDAGGDSRGKQSAALLVVKDKGGYGGFDDRYIDLRVDDHQEPVSELTRLLELHQLYFKKSESKDILKIEGPLKDQLISQLLKLDYISSDQPTDEQLFEGLHSFHLIENFDERIQNVGYVDKKVVEFIENLVKRED